jgi:hypothetical protein
MQSDIITVAHGANVLGWRFEFRAHAGRVKLWNTAFDQKFAFLKFFGFDLTYFTSLRVQGAFGNGINSTPLTGHWAYY